MNSALSNGEAWSLLALSLASIGVIANTFQGDGEPLIASLAFSSLAFALTYSLIRWLGKIFIKANLKGRDMSKVKRVEIPETMGGVCAAVYLLLMILFMPILFYSDIKYATNDEKVLDLETVEIETGRVLHKFPLGKLASYQSAMLSLALVVILGNYDDLFDIRWRHKVLIPGIAALPLLAVYFLTYGVTHVIVPVQLEKYLGSIIDLGWLYYVYMAAITIFCPNSINILAGINGIEVSQSLIIAGLLLGNDAISLYTVSKHPSYHPATDLHLFSIYMLLPFMGVSLALLMHNWYPAKVFVGDTYCYFAGMVFAIVSILGHFSKTLLLLFIPQIINFLYSTPQLFRLVPCPRHRLPRFDIQSGLLEPSMTQWPRPPPTRTAILLKTLARFPGLPLIRLVYDEGGTIVESSNLTILNLWLVWFGPKKENVLVMQLTAFQAVLGTMGLLVRHRLALFVFRQDNRM